MADTAVLVAEDFPFRDWSRIRPSRIKLPATRPLNIWSLVLNRMSPLPALFSNCQAPAAVLKKAPPPACRMSGLLFGSTGLLR